MKQIRAWIMESGGVIDHDELRRRIVDSYRPRDLRRSVEALANEEIRKAIRLKDSDGFVFAKRHGDVVVVLSGPHGTAHTEEQLYAVVADYRARAVRYRHQGWKHVRFGWIHKRVDLRAAMEPTDEEMLVQAEDINLADERSA